MSIVIITVGVVGNCAYVAWVAAAWTIHMAKRMGDEPRPIFRNIYHELRPFYWAAVLALRAPIIMKNGLLAYVLDWVHYLSWGISIFVWVALKDIDDDDRWKRRRKKLAEAVKQIGDRLVVVVPVPVRS